jgi:hypothetical protein
MALAAALLPACAAALEIYTWVDEDGVVHYSESTPVEPAATPVETLYIADANSPAYDPDDYYWSILNQAERIGEQWSTIQEEKAEAEAETRAVATETRVADLERQLAAHEATEYADRPYYGPYAFFPKRHHRPLNRGRHARPAHAVHPPPRTDRDLTIPDPEPRPGWTRPKPPAGSPTPGFSR